MRQLQPAAGLRHALIGQHVDIDGARSPALLALALHVALDAEAGVEQRLGGKRRLHQRAGVEEPVLVGLAPRRRAIEPRDGGDAAIRPPVERLQGIGHGADGIADIAAEAERGPAKHFRRHGRPSPAHSRARPEPARSACEP